MTDSTSRSAVVARIEFVIESLLVNLSSTLTLPRLSSATVHAEFDDEYAAADPPQPQSPHPVINKSFSLSGSKSFASVLLVLSFCHTLLLSNRTTTIRELYYHYCTIECNNAIADASLLLGLDRSHMGLFASPKGWIVGSFELKSPSGSVRYNPTSGEPLGVSISAEWLSASTCPVLESAPDAMLESRATGPATFSSDAQFIVVVEKEGIYARLAEDCFFDKVPCIVVTGKGVPDLATRACVRVLSSTLSIPVLGLCDCNPYGLGVLMAYRQGGKLTTVSSHLYSSDIRWLGLRPSQVAKISKDLPDVVFQELSSRDRDKLASLARAPFVSDSDHYQDEIELMLAGGFKMELEALSWLGVDYLSNCWLEPAMLTGDYL